MFRFFLVESVLKHICILKFFEKVRKYGKKWSFKKSYIIAKVDAKHTLLCIRVFFIFYFSATNIQKLIIQNWKFNIIIDIQISLRIMGLRVILHLRIMVIGQHIIWFPL